MNDNLIIMGINAPRQHQAIITQLIYELAKLYKEGKTSLFPLPETMIDESQTSPVPDVMVVEPTSGLTKMIIEVTHTQGVKKDLKKLKDLMADYDVPEGFVYDYKLDAWYRCETGRENVDEDSYSRAVKQDLRLMLDTKIEF
ncbi:MAG: Uma2 family endonuclease [Phaeodactylibacter sp.]|nr:Uma2 family endonuclease [Phaeodactylibacter sp.]